MPTRNGISYTAESLSKYCDFFNKNGKTIPSLDTHNDESIRKFPPFGHIEKLFMNGNDLMYQMDVDPEEKMFIHKAKRGDISEVSIQAIVDQIEEKEDFDTGDGIIIADVRELLEISPVLIPGSRDSNMQFLEKMGHNVTKGNLHKLEKKYGLSVTEKRLVEKFKKGFYKEQQDEDPEIINEEPPKDEDEKNPNLQKPNREEVGTDNGKALISKGLDKKVKKSELMSQVHRSNLLKVVTKRIILK